MAEEIPSDIRAKSEAVADTQWLDTFSKRALAKAIAEAIAEAVLAERSRAQAEQREADAKIAEGFWQSPASPMEKEQKIVAGTELPGELIAVPIRDWMHLLGLMELDDTFKVCEACEAWLTIDETCSAGVVDTCWAYALENYDKYPCYRHTRAAWQSAKRFHEDVVQQLESERQKRKAVEQARQE